MKKYFKKKNQTLIVLEEDPLPIVLEKDPLPIVLKDDNPTVDLLQTPINAILGNLPSVHDAIRSWYMQSGPCQPLEHKFLQTVFSEKKRRFNSAQFTVYYTLKLAIVFPQILCFAYVAIYSKKKLEIDLGVRFLFQKASKIGRNLKNYLIMLETSIVVIQSIGKSIVISRIRRLKQQML